MQRMKPWILGFAALAAGGCAISSSPVEETTEGAVADGAGTTVTWTDSHQYDMGLNPSVASSGTNVIEVHQGTSGVGALWYRTGTLSAAQ